MKEEYVKERLKILDKRISALEIYHYRRCPNCKQEVKNEF